MSIAHKRRILQGSASNITRVLLAMLVGLVLPPLLVHRMTTAEYGAWLLILQCSAYINMLDLGLQTAIGKFVAEYSAIPDRITSTRILSSSFVILCVSAAVGAIGIGIIVWKVPELFHQMPVNLVRPLRGGILAVGLSTAIALPFNAFLAAFTGLQEYGFPTLLSSISKLLTSAALAALILMNGSLVELALLTAVFNILTAAGQYLGWRKYARERVGFLLRLVDRASIVKLVKYGSVLSAWVVAALFISGFDMIIVGHYDYKNTGYYGIATSVTNFMLLIITSLFGPLLPAVSSVQAGRSPKQIGNIVITTTRYCALLICLLFLPFLLGAYPALKLWVGQSYALHSVLFLEVLILGNGIRQLGYPYAIVVVATGKQHLATISGVIEAAVNVCVSIYLVQRIGAIGVAIGTLVGAFISVGVHVTVSMALTHSTILISRRRFLLQGLARPLACVIPSLLLLPFWKRLSMLPANPSALALWTLTTLAIVWFVGLTRNERLQLRNTALRLIHWDQVRT
jgi:O-antigen/teichoic acid export membrane protein